MNDETGRAMLGYWLATPGPVMVSARGAVAEVVVWARAQSRLRVIWALVAEVNRPNRRVLEANGFAVVDRRAPDERGDVPLGYEIELRARSVA